MNFGTSQRALRTDASTSSPATRVPPHWRSSQTVPVTPSIASKPSHGSKNVIVCNAQQYGRGQPPNQPQQPMALARRPIYQPVQPQQPVFLNLSQVSDKQVITRNTGKNLGTMGEAWVDPQRLEVVSFEVESKRGVGSSVTGNVPLAMLKQIGDVVLVQDELPPDQVPLDARYGFIKLLGLEVRTRMGRVLGKVRDIAFNPDTGAISRIEYDDFGLRFLPVNFFDTFSVPAELVESAAYGYVLVAAEGESYQRQEKQGILSGILRGLGTRQQPMGLLLTDGSRSEVAGYLPQNYTYEKWESDIRRWEAETGMRYEEYMMAQQQRLGGPAGMLPAPGGSSAAPGGYMARGPPQQQQQQPMPGAARPGMGMGVGPGPQQQQQRYAAGPAAPGGGPGAPAGPGAVRPGLRPGVPAPGALPPQQQQYGAAAAAPGTSYGAGGYGAAADPRFRGAGPAGGAPPRYGGPQQQQQQPAQQQQAGWPAQPQQQQGGPAGWPPAGAPTPVQQRQQPQQQQQQAPQPGGGRPGALGAQPQQQQAPQQAPQQAQQAGQYGWPGPDGGAAGGPGSGPSASANGSGNGTAASGGAMRVEEWLARESVAQPQPAQAAAVEPAAMANGWEVQGGRGGGQY